MPIPRQPVLQIAGKLRHRRPAIVKPEQASRTPPLIECAWIRKPRAAALEPDFAGTDQPPRSGIVEKRIALRTHHAEPFAAEIEGWRRDNLFMRECQWRH